LSGYYAADPTAYTEAKLELKTYESIAAEKVKSAKVTLGETEDVRLMTTYYKMTTDEAKKQYAVNQQNLTIEDKQSEITKQIAKDKAKANKTSTATTTESYTGWNSLVGAIESANTALGKNEVSTMSVETAQNSLKTAENHLKDALAESETIKTAASVSDAAKVALNSKLQQSSYNVAAATKEVTTSQSNLRAVTERTTKSEKDADAAMTASMKATGLLKESHKDYRAALNEAEQSQVDLTDAIQTYGYGSSEVAAATENAKHKTEEYTIAVGQQKEEMASIVSVVNGLGDAYATMTGSSLKGISGIETGLKTMADHSKVVIKGLSNELAGALQIAQGLGKSIGGGFGNAVSSTASGAIGGASLATALSSILGFGGPTGAIIGGGIGLISSLFGGGHSDSQIQQLDSTNAASRQSIEQMAAAGSTVAMRIMAIAGYSDAKLNDLRTGTPGVSSLGLPTALTGGSQTSLFDNDWSGLKGQNLVSYLQGLQQIETAIKAIASPTIYDTISKINYKWDALIATMGASADIEQARMNDLIASITGISANTVGNDIVASFNSYTGFADAGTAAATKIKDETVSAIQQMTISNMLIQPVMDMIQPMLETVVTKMRSGIALTADDLTGLKSVYDSALSSVTPLINSTFDLFKATGVLTSAQQVQADTATATASATSSLTTATTDLGTAATKTAAEIVSERSTLLNSYYNLIGDTATIRASDLAALDETNQALQQSIWDITDANTAATAAATQASTDATALTNAQTTLASAQTTLTSALTTQSDYVASLQTAAETAAYNAIQDAATAAATGLTNAKTAVTDALSALQDSITAEKDALTAIYDAQKAALDAQVTAQDSLVSSISSISDSLHSALKEFIISGNASTSATLRSTAQADLASMISKAKQGVLPDSSTLSTLITALKVDSQAQFGSFTDYARDYYKTVAQVQALSTYTDYQLTDAQKQLSVLDQQLTVLKDTYTVDTQSLDATYNVAVQQVNATYGVNTSVLAVSTAVSGVQVALGNYSAAQLTSQQASAAATTAAIARVASDAAASNAATNAQIAANSNAVAAAIASLTTATAAVATASAAAASSAAAQTAAQAAADKARADAAAALAASTAATAAQAEAAKDTSFKTNKAAQLNAMDWQGKSTWSVSDVGTLFNSLGMTSQQYSAQYATAQSLPAYGTSGTYSQDTAQKMYSLFLGRAASTAEDTYYTKSISDNSAALGTATAGITQTVKQFLGSAEFMNAHTTVTSLYESILMRTPTAAEVAWWTSSGATLASIKDQFVDSAEYARIRAVRGFSQGGYHDGGWMMVGEKGSELVNTGSSAARIYNHQQTQSLIDISALVASNNRISKAIEGLRLEMQAGDAAIALNTSRLVKILQQEFQSGGTLG